MAQIDTMPSPPHSLDALLRQLWQLYRGHWVTLVGCIAAVWVPVTLLGMIVSWTVLPDFFAFQQQAMTNPSPEEMREFTAEFNRFFGTFFGVTCILALIQLAAFPLATAAATYSAADAFLERPVSLVTAFQRALKVWPRLILVYLFALFIGLILLLWTLIPCVGWISGPGMLVFFQTVVVALVVPVLLLEETGTPSLRRAWDLSRREFWWSVGVLLGLAIVVGLVSGIVSWGLTALLNLVPGVAPMSFPVEITPSLVITNAISSLISLTFTVAGTSLQTTMVVLLYFDLRGRIDGFDVAGARAAFADSSEAIIPGPSITAVEAGLITWNDFGKMIILTVALLVLYGVIFCFWSTFGIPFMQANMPYGSGF